MEYWTVAHDSNCHKFGSAPAPNFKPNVAPNWEKTILMTFGQWALQLIQKTLEKPYFNMKRDSI